MRTSSSAQQSRALTMLASVALVMIATSATTTSAEAGTDATRRRRTRKKKPSSPMMPPPMPKHQQQQHQRRRMPYLNAEDLVGYMGDGHKNYDIENLAENWVPVSEDVEFLPLLNMNDKNTNDKNTNTNTNTNNDKARRTLQKKTRSLGETSSTSTSTSTTTEETTGAWTDYDPYSVQPFVEGMSEYDEYQQAWRLLGFTIDCNAYMDDDYEMSGGSGGSGDNEITDEGCARYVIWAAYVDLEYGGGGIGEYQYWNRTSGSWDDTSCQYAEGGSHQSGGSNDNNNNNDNDDDNNDNGSRCAKMDCHSEDTHFSVLGFFKHRNYDDWMEQLFKHEGMCVWTREEYAFMKGARKAWPKGCAATGTTVTVSAGKYGQSSASLYYNIRPLRNGRIGLGLYTDEQCIAEYPASTDYVESVIGNVFLENDSQDSNDNYDYYDFGNDTLADSMDRWDEAFDVWHMCHPCVAHDLNNTAGDKYLNDDDDDDGGRVRKLGGEYSAQGDVFECYDDAGYTNVNQCMKFSAKTVMKTATFRDLSLGRNQGSLVEYPLSGYVDASKQYRAKTLSNVGTYFFLFSSSCALCLSLWVLFKTAMMARRRANVGVATNSDALLV